MVADPTQSDSPGTSPDERPPAPRGLQQADDLLPLVYQELRSLAASRLRTLPPGQTLQPTALVHDVYLRLIGDADPGWKGRAHFFGAAAMAMRNILVDQARRKGSVKHGGGRQRQRFFEDAEPGASWNCDPADVLALDQAMSRLEHEYPRHARVVTLRYFAGLSIEQVAELMDVGISTVKRDWRFARVWLRRELEPDAEPEDGA
ncbi:MAG: ECF-type sigma factor [Phycisphaerales bacterium JB059]